VEQGEGIDGDSEGGNSGLNEPEPIEIYGSEKVYETEFLAKRMRASLMNIERKEGERVIRINRGIYNLKFEARNRNSKQSQMTKFLMFKTSAALRI